MNNRPLKLFGIATLVMQCLIAGACSSSSSNGGVGGNGGAGTGTGGMAVSGAGGDVAHPGSCTPGVDNPDSVVGGACTDDCASVSCGRACHFDCCVTCGIDQTGSKFCTCPNPGGPYDNCTCAKPATIPDGLHGGPCMPAGDSRVTPPTGTISLRNLPCKALNLVCFTSDSTASSERGCICQPDPAAPGNLILHCGSVNHWFTNDAVPTTYTP